MAFSTIPIYLDPQSWRQQGTNHQLDDRTTDHLPVLNAENQRRVPENHAGGSGTAKPNSMVERARQEKIPLPESALRCPRCDSTNTKFCYFNNYSLSQPRHFCKTCRRYWTRGGALRNVPVGGGYRRNKRTSKPNSRSKSRVTIPPRHHQQQPPPPFIPPANNMSHQGFITNPNKLLSHGQISNLPSNLPILPPLQSLGDYSNSVLDAGLNFEGFQVGNSVSNLCHIDHWRSSLQQFQQFPFLINSTSSSNLLFPLMEDNNVQNAAAGAGDDDNNSGSVKIEEKINNNQDFPGNDDLYSRNFLGNINLNSGNDRFSWGGGEGGSSSSWTADHLQNGFGSDSNPATHIF